MGINNESDSKATALYSNAIPLRKGVAAGTLITLAGDFRLMPAPRPDAR